MICPEGDLIVQGESIVKEEEGLEFPTRDRNVPAEGSGSLEINNYKNPKTWKKSITNFFRNQLRSTRSIDGDRPSGSKENFEEKEISPEQKWQSLGKIFRRQSLAENWSKSPNELGESSSHHSKRLAVKKVLSSYFAKAQKSKLPVPDEN